MSFRNYLSLIGLMICINIGIAQQNVIINVIEIASGRIVKTITSYTAQKGNNDVVVDMKNANVSDGLYIVNIASNSQSFKPAKLMVNK